MKPRLTIYLRPSYEQRPVKKTLTQTLARVEHAAIALRVRLSFLRSDRDDRDLLHFLDIV